VTLSRQRHQAQYKIKKKRKANKTTESPTVSGRGQLNTNSVDANSEVTNVSAGRMSDKRGG